MAEVIDRKGQRFGHLVVIERGPPTSSGSSWRCQCKCGEVITVTASNLKKGQTQCFECSAESKRQDLTDKRFGRLVVYEFSHSYLSRPFWACRCDCGNDTTVMAQSLTTGNTTSCGCFGLEQRNAGKRTHGMTKHQLYDAWTNMKQRCFNPKNPVYEHYGARGITVCERWMTFQNFVDDMLPTWTKGLTIERIDNDGNYEDGNCTWIPQSFQPRNQRDTIKVLFRGQEVSLTVLAETYGINKQTLRSRWRAGDTGEELIR